MSKIDIDRQYYEVVPSAFGLFGWKFTHLGAAFTGLEDTWEVLARFRTKQEAVFYAVDYCATGLKAYKINSELTIKSRLGRIQDKRTYGADPRSSHG